jgi:hypothetical protein
MEIALAHPLLHVPAQAVTVNYFRNGRGRAIGYVVQFADGHLASLTYGEIGQLREALREDTDANAEKST